MIDASMLLNDIVITSLRVLVWTLLSWVLGVGIGFACYRNKIFGILAMPVVNFIRHISPFCWLPLIILAAGIGEVSVGITLLISLTFHAVIVSLEMLRSLPRIVLEQARLDGASGWALFSQIELPVCISGIVDIFRVLWGVGWSVVIAAEMLGVSSGMGYRLLDFRYLLRYKEMLVYIVIIGCIGIGTDYLLKRLKSVTELRTYA
ncbi:MAG: hypothetical protein CVU50_00400 [Candidatus Cloacimonetes bacterium HGW-Cloacimonetes-3]|jgi:ABC-type nitrate/sulfonate/bicarbonate transport system permease component|nr:MAG: hypothetical protein CVU50_00400 [Candidatus Cloacimonetes bacterium HGW-Cloacimonetes-3]